MSKKKFIIKVLVQVIAALLLIGGMLLYCEKRLAMKEVYIAKYHLNSRTLITEEEITKIRVPAAYLNAEVCLNKDDIVGKYVKINSQIPTGSFFYQTALDDKENMKDKINSELQEDEVCFDLFINDVKVNQASIVKGMYVDLYLTINKENVLSDMLLNNVKIIGLYDNNNQEIKDYDNQAILNTICLAIPKTAVNYLNKALVIGELSIIVGDNTYIDVDSYVDENSLIFPYVQ